MPDHKTVIRSGFGIYTNQAAYSIIQNAALNLPFYFAKTVTNSAALCAERCLQHGKHSGTAANGSVSANNINHDFKIEYNNVWNLSVERSLSSSTSIQAQYIGSYTVHADNETYQNLFPDNALAAGPLHVRPIPQMSGFPSVTWDGWEKYHALALTFTQRLWRGLTVNSNYTWSKALDDASNPGRGQCRAQLSSGPRQSGGGKGTFRFRPPESFRHQLPVSDSVLEEFGRLGPHRVWRVAGGRHLDTAKRGALYGESLDGRRQQRRTLVRAIATAESDLQSKQRSKNNGGMVQYILLRGARSIYLWQRGPRHCDRARPRRLRCDGSEGISCPREYEAAVPAGRI